MFYLKDVSRCFKRSNVDFVSIALKPLIIQRAYQVIQGVPHQEHQGQTPRGKSVPIYSLAFAILISILLGITVGRLWIFFLWPSQLQMLCIPYILMIYKEDNCYRIISFSYAILQLHNRMEGQLVQQIGRSDTM